MPQTSFIHVTLKRTFATGGEGEVIDLNFSPDFGEGIVGSEAVTYLGTKINQSFSSIFIHNKTTDEIVFSLEEDVNNDISFTLSGGDGMASIGADKHFFENQLSIHRLRIKATVGGDVEIILGNEK